MPPQPLKEGLLINEDLFPPQEKTDKDKFVEIKKYEFFHLNSLQIYKTGFAHISMTRHPYIMKGLYTTYSWDFSCGIIDMLYLQFLPNNLKNPSFCCFLV